MQSLLKKGCGIQASGSGVCVASDLSLQRGQGSELRRGIAVSERISRFTAWAATLQWSMQLSSLALSSLALKAHRHQSHSGQCSMRFLLVTSVMCLYYQCLGYVALCDATSTMRALTITSDSWFHHCVPWTASLAEKKAHARKPHILFDHLSRRAPTTPLCRKENFLTNGVAYLHRNLENRCLAFALSKLCFFKQVLGQKSL